MKFTLRLSLLMSAALVLFISGPVLAHCGHCGMRGSEEHGKHLEMAHDCDKCAMHGNYDQDCEHCKHHGKRELKCADCEKKGHHGMHEHSQQHGGGHDHGHDVQDREQLEGLFEKN